MCLATGSKEHNIQIFLSFDPGMGQKGKGGGETSKLPAVKHQHGVGLSDSFSGPVLVCFSLIIKTTVYLRLSQHFKVCLG